MSPKKENLIVKVKHPAVEKQSSILIQHYNAASQNL
jgi:hypothetical protein